MILALLASCSRTPSLAPVSRATVVLDGGWSEAPWDTPSENARALTLSTTLDLPEGLAGAGSELRLDGAWWEIQATTNGQVSATTGGIVPTWVDLGGALKAGQNTLALRIVPPVANASTLMTGGSMTSAARAPRGAQLQSAPTLILQPAQHVSYAEVGATPEALHPRAVLDGVPDGATVRFRAVLDGRVLAELGQATVAGGIAQAPAVPWRGDTWGIGEGALFWLSAELRSADGTVLDRWDGRTGARAAQPAEGGLRIGDQVAVLMGARMVNDADTEAFRERLRGFAQAGVNALEIHGEQLREDWLSAADELGLPVVIVPRCIGRAGRSRHGARQALDVLYADQDRRMQRALAEHPSAVLYAVEGPTGGARLHSGDILQGSPGDGARLPVAGSEQQLAFDLPARVLHIAAGDTFETLQTSCMPKSCQDSWVVEITPYWNRSRSRAPSPQAQWALCAAAFQRHLEQGSPGGIIPTPNRNDTAGWVSSWRAVADAAQIPQVSGSGRGPSGLTVTGLAPGALAWLDAPLLSPVGAVADSSGTAVFSLWHQGAATVRAEGHEVDVQLVAGAWDGFTWRPHVVSVSLPPAAP